MKSSRVQKLCSVSATRQGKQSPTSSRWWESLTLESQTSFTWLLSHDRNCWWSLPQRLLPLCRRHRSRFEAVCKLRITSCRHDVKLYQRNLDFSNYQLFNLACELGLRCLGGNSVSTLQGFCVQLQLRARSSWAVFLPSW